MNQFSFTYNYYYYYYQEVIRQNFVCKNGN